MSDTFSSAVESDLSLLEIEVLAIGGDLEGGGVAETANGSVLAPVTPLRACPDCGNFSSGAYCTVCGEEIEPNLPSIKHYFKELFNEFLAFDSKLIRTIPALFFKPGFLTTEYVAGRRKRYLLPSRVYILVAFLVFFSLNTYIHLELGTWLATTSTHIQLNNLTKPEIESFMDTLARLVTTVAPYVLLLECSPLFALALKLLYRKRQILFAEHLIFTFHLFAVALVVVLPTALTGSSVLQSIGLITFILYTGLALRKTYGTIKWQLAWRLPLVVLTFFVLVIQAALVSLILAMAAGYIFDLLPLKGMIAT